MRWSEEYAQLFSPSSVDAYTATTMPVPSYTARPLGEILQGRIAPRAVGAKGPNRPTAMAGTNVHSLRPRL